MLVEELLDLLRSVPATAPIDIRLLELRTRNEVVDVRYVYGRARLLIGGDDASRPIFPLDAIYVARAD